MDHCVSAIPRFARLGHGLRRRAACARVAIFVTCIALGVGSVLASPAGFEVPAGREEIVHPYGRDVPGPVADFIGERGEGWIVAWDRSLETPASLVPARPWQRGGVSTGSAFEQLQSTALGVVSDFEDLLGVGSAELGTPSAIEHVDGFNVSFPQVFDAVPIRGAYIFARFTRDLRLVSLRATLVRDPAPREAFLFDEESARARLTELGVVEPRALYREWGVVEDAPKVLVPLWGATLETDAGGAELLLSGSTGERLGARSLVLEWAGPDVEPIDVDITLTGYCPDPDDMYAIPGDFGPELQPLPRQRVTVSGPNLGEPTSRSALTDRDGKVTIRHTPLPGDTSYAVRYGVFPGPTWPDQPERREYFREGWTDVDLPGTRFARIFNDERSIEGSTHLLAANHYARARADVEELFRTHSLQQLIRGQGGFDLGVDAQRVRIDGDEYRHRYDFVRQYIFLASNETSPDARDDAGRLEKLVPTIVHHEYGHFVFHSLTAGDGDAGVNEGFADAIAGYVSRLGVVGFTAPGEPNTDPWARDLARDQIAFRDERDPAEARRTVAGAMWELWTRTIDGTDPVPEPQEEEELPRSSFAFGLLVRGLAMNHIGTPWQPGRAIPYGPTLGIDFLVESDRPVFGGDEDLRNGSRHDAAVLDAFGRRNLLPHAFMRGDANGNGDVEMADAIVTFSYLFLSRGDEAICADAMDTNDSGSIDLTDGIHSLRYLFLGGEAPSFPFPSCGWDITVRDGLGCQGSVCKYFPATD
jgi:hypothetical protein